MIEILHRVHVHNMHWKACVFSDAVQDGLLVPASQSGWSIDQVQRALKLMHLRIKRLRTMRLIFRVFVNVAGQTLDFAHQTDECTWLILELY